MKILVVSNFFPPHFIGGAEIVAWKQARALADAGHQLQVFAGDNRLGRPGYAVSADVYDGLPVTRIELSHADFAHGGRLANPVVDTHFARLLDSFRPDLIHAHHLLGLSLGILEQARVRAIPLCLTVHDHWGFCYHSTRITTAGSLCTDASACAITCPHHIDDGHARLPPRLRQDYLRWQLHKASAFIFPSHYLAQAYQALGLPAERCEVIANGIELATFTPAVSSAISSAITPAVSAPPRLRLLFIGYMGPHKGLPVLLDALASLPPASQQRLHLDLVGDGHALVDYRARLQRELPALSHHAWGRLPNAEVAARLQSADVFLLPSVCPENQPVSITEAMASGLPVIASAIGGIPELVSHQHSGLLCAAGDPAALAGAIQHYLDHPADLACHGAAGRARIAAFDLDRQRDRLLALFTRLLASGAASPSLPSPAIACLGAPDPLTLQRWQPFPPASLGTAPALLPAGWLQAPVDLLWLGASRRSQRADSALAHADCYHAAARPVLVELPANQGLHSRLPAASLFTHQPLARALALAALAPINPSQPFATPLPSCQ
ncbi:MAG: glycosyltransferase family 4 protein [Thauera sp.]|jgi:glycosyltransferase involved in cell wall biosynthesis|nr:glycosyltransferase family 4 protein [Thauera sp.]